MQWEYVSVHACVCVCVEVYMHVCCVGNKYAGWQNDAYNPNNAVIYCSWCEFFPSKTLEFIKNLTYIMKGMDKVIIFSFYILSIYKLQHC